MKASRKRVQDERRENKLPSPSLFTQSTSNSAKGVALLLLLWHHLFIEYPEYQQFVYYSALMAKVCVAIFLLLSGYGLAKSNQLNPMGLWSFYKKRLSHLYLNYWFIALIFVPMGVYFFNRPIAGVFGTYPYLKFAVQMLGFHLYFEDIGYGYNPTWWYMSIIIGLYLLFPFMYKAIKHYGGWALGPAMVLLMLPDGSPFGITALQYWVFPFMFGIYLALNDSFENISSVLKKTGRVRYLILVILLVLMVLLRYQLSLVHYTFGLRIDGLMGSLIILSVFELTRQFAIIGRGLAFLGEHLYNIFLFHTFIFYFFFQKFIYSFQIPILIFLVLLVLCVGISFLLEMIKKWIGFEKIQQAVDRIPMPDRFIID
jgi:peptidoglycan/LPS O-acetylase OafA/YrhL